MNVDFEKLMNKNDVGIKILDILLSFTTVYKMSSVWYSLRMIDERAMSKGYDIEIWHFETDYFFIYFWFSREGLVEIKMGEFFKSYTNSFDIDVELNEESIDKMVELLNISLVKKSLS